MLLAVENLEFSYYTLMTMIHRRIFRPSAQDNHDENSDNGIIVHDTRKRSRNILLHSARMAIHVVRKIGEHHRQYIKTKWYVHLSCEGSPTCNNVNVAAYLG